MNLTKTKYTIIGTPKAIGKVLQIPELIPYKYRDHTLEATHLVYMNCSEGWKPSECDEVLYIVDNDEFYKNTFLEHKLE